MTTPGWRSIMPGRKAPVQANGGEQVDLQYSLPVLVGEHLESAWFCFYSAGIIHIRSSLEMCLIEHGLECILVLTFFHASPSQESGFESRKT